MPEEKKFPAPRVRVVAPYRQSAPPPPPLVVDEKSVKLVEPPKPRDLLEELEKVEIDPHVLAEARSANRSWGSVMIAFGLFMIIVGVALDVSAMSSHVRPPTPFVFLPIIGVATIVLGIRTWRRRGIEF